MSRVSVQGGFLVLLALMLFLLDPAVSLSILGAAAVHESGHLLAIRLCGGRFRQLRLGLTGAEIDYAGRRLSYRQEALCALAGPAAGFILALFLSLLGRCLDLEALYLPAGAALLQSLFNLLPARRLDGGRALYMLACARWGLERAESCACLLSCLSAFALLCLGAWLLWETKRNFTLLLLGAWLLFGECRRLTNPL